MMDARDDVGVVVGVFRAQAAAEALVRAGFAPEAVRLVELDSADAALLEELTEADRIDWQQELENLEGTLVIVSERRRDEARSILAEHGAEDVAADDAPVAAVPLPESSASGSDVGVPAITGRLRPDMLVVGSDYVRVGRIKRVEGRELLLDRRPVRRDAWVPLLAVDKLIGDWVVLTMPADRVDPMEPFMRPRIGERTENPRRADGEETA
ncbi:MAG: DUF2171 domain-containing protein [Chloroflexota bacterium]|nr:DUF2171 domain-containing protein [Chloroflexota bacterium]